MVASRRDQQSEIRKIMRERVDKNSGYEKSALHEKTSDIVNCIKKYIM